MHALAGCHTITFESIDVGSSFSHIVYLQGIRVKFTYECHRVKMLIRGWSCLRFKGIHV